MARYVDDRERITRNVVVDENGCWIWQRSIHKNGYGRVWHQGRIRKAHIVSYETFVGSVPDGLELDHRCRVRACVNPACLEPVTGLVNQRRSPLTNAGKDRCKHGHRFTPENTHWQNRPGELRPTRICLTCRRNYTAQYRARAKEKAS